MKPRLEKNSLILDYEADTLYTIRYNSGRQFTAGITSHTKLGELRQEVTAGLRQRKVRDIVADIFGWITAAKERGVTTSTNGGINSRISNI